nr:RNA 2',3'-cyclic phosphodiesterase [Gammaproteobacteria bacterium]
MSLRLFAAIAVPDEIADRLAPLQRGVQGAAWRPREALHLTLRFFGEIDERLAEELDHELGRIRIPPFEVGLKGAGW